MFHRSTEYSVCGNFPDLVGLVGLMAVGVFLGMGMFPRMGMFLGVGVFLAMGIFLRKSGSHILLGSHPHCFVAMTLFVNNTLYTEQPLAIFAACRRSDMQAFTVPHHVKQQPLALLAHLGTRPPPANKAVPGSSTLLRVCSGPNHMWYSQGAAGQ